MLGGRVDDRLRGVLKPHRDRKGWRLPTGRRTWLIGGAVLAVVAAGVGWLLWPSDQRPDPRARVYTEASACLLTPASGVVDKAAAPVWQGMQQASLATRGKVSFLEVNGPQTGDNAATYLGTLAVGDCDLILAVGSGPVAALDARAPAYPKIRFVAVGGGKAQANVTVVREPDAAHTAEKVRALVNDVLSRAAD